VTTRSLLTALAAAGMLLLAAVESPAGQPSRFGTFTTTSGTWTLSIGETELTGIGTDVSSTYAPATASGFVTMSITVGGYTNWRVTAVRSAGTWNASLLLSVVLTNRGTPQVGSPLNTTLLLTTTDTEFITGTTDCGATTPVGVTLSLGGISVTLGPGTYATTVTYTIAGY